MRVFKGILIGVCIILGILLSSNLDKGIEQEAPDQLQLTLKKSAALAEVLAKVPDAKIADEQAGIVTVPYGETKQYTVLFKQDDHVLKAESITIPPTYKFRSYLMEIENQLKRYVTGDLGSIRYSSKVDREYSILEHLGAMVSRSLSYLVPGLFFGVVSGLGLALLAVLRPKVGRVFDNIHAVLLGVPDFFLVVILQLVAILLAKAAGHNVILIMQFSQDTPFLIPFLAISILPGVLVYGAMRIALEREWQEDYIKTAYSKGMTRSMVLWWHILRNTMHDIITILPRAVTVAISSMVVAEVMTAVFGLGGYAMDTSLADVTSLPTTCIILACFAIVAHLLIALLRKMFVVNTKEGA